MTDALDRSLMLAAAMDARGHGRTADVPATAAPHQRRAPAASGLCGVCVGTYALLDGTVARSLGPARADARRRPGRRRGRCSAIGASRPRRTAPTRGERRSGRSRRAASSSAVGLLLSARLDAGDLNPSAQLLQWPVLPLVAFVLVVLACGCPLWPAPRVPRMIRFDAVSFTYAGADAPVLRDLDFAIAEGELCVVVGRTGVGKSTLLGAINGLVPHFTGGHLAGEVVGRRPRHADPQAARPGRRRRLRRPGPAGGLRHRHRRGGAGLRDGAARRRAGGDAQAGGGDARPARHRRAAPPRAAHAVGRPAAARRHRLRAHRAPPRARARRADLRARPDRRRRRAGRGHPARARPRHHRRDGRAPARAGGAPRRPVVLLPRRRRAPRSAPPRGGVRRRPARSAGRRARAAARLGRRCRCRSATPAAAPDRSARDCRDRVPRRRRGTAVAHDAGSPAVGAGASSSVPGRGRGARRRPRRCAPARSSRSWGATARASRRCCGRCRARVAAHGGARRRGRSRPGGLAPARPAGWSASSRRRPATCSTSTTVAEECAQADRDAGSRRRARCRACSIGSSPASPGDQHPRDLSEGQRLAPGAGGAARRPRPGRAARRADPRPRPRGQGALHRDRPRSSPPRDAPSSIATHDVEFVAAVADRVDRDGRRRGRRRRPDRGRRRGSSPAFAPQVAKMLHPDAVADRRPRSPTALRECWRDRRAVTAVSALGVAPRIVLALVSLGRAGDVRLAAAWSTPPTGVAHASDAPLIFVALLPVPRRRRARRDDGRRHGHQGAGHARRALRDRRGAASARRRHRRHRDGVLPARPRRPRVRPGFGFVLGSTTLFASALLTGGWVRGCRSRCWRRRGSGSAPGCCPG